MTTRPAPDVRGAGGPYWRAGRDGVLRLPRCTACGRLFWYPRVHCPHCGADAVEWVATSGRGRVHTFTIVRRSPEPFFAARVPYVVAMIELAEGPRVMANVVECDVADVHIGMPVTVLFEDLGDDVHVPLFRPAARERAS
jgi:hypothetical protein